MGDIVTETIPLIELSPIPVIFAEGIASALIVGSNVHIVFYDARMMSSQKVHYPVLELIRPLASCLHLTLRELLKVQLRATEGLH